MFDMSKIGKKIANLRKEKNMTQMELADKLGISFQAVSNWERGNSMPDIAKLPELAEIFGVSLDELLGEESVLVEAAIDDRMAECVENSILSTEDLESVLPLLKPSQVSELAQIAEEMETFDVGGIEQFLPFMSDRDVKEFAKQAAERGENISGYLPFMNGKDVKEFAVQAAERGENIQGYLPFMEAKDVKELALKVLSGKR